MVFIQPPIQWQTGSFFLGVKRPDYEFYHSFSPRGEVINHGATSLIPL